MATLLHFFPRKERPQPPAAVPDVAMPDAHPETAPPAPSGGEDSRDADDPGDDLDDDEIQLLNEDVTVTIYAYFELNPQAGVGADRPARYTPEVHRKAVYVGQTMQRILGRA